MADKLNKLLKELKQDIPNDINNLILTFCNLEQKINKCDLCEEEDFDNFDNFILQCRLKNTYMYCIPCSKHFKELLCEQCYSLCEKCSNISFRDRAFILEYKNYRCFKCYNVFCELCMELHDNDTCHEEKKII